MKCKDCPQREGCDSAIKDLDHPDIKCLRYNKVQLPCLPGDDVYWIDESCRGGPKIIREPAAIEAVCYYGPGDFRVICHGDESNPEPIGTKWCCLTREDAERVLREMKNDG